MDGKEFHLKAGRTGPDKRHRVTRRRDKDRENKAWQKCYGMEKETGKSTGKTPTTRRMYSNRQNKWIETITTILLSAASILSAWCVYEASQWNGEQFFRIEDENNADRKRMQKVIASYQRQSAEVTLFLQYVDAVTTENKEKADFLLKRFPPHLKKALYAWKALDPLNNPEAPVSPMQMKEYVPPEKEDIDRYTEQAMQFKQAANRSDNHSDNYMLLSLVLSSVLFFCGLSGTLDSRANKLILVGLALLIFLVTLFYVIKLPMII